MLGVPAKVAGCKEIIFASPPRKDGSVCPEVLYVAEKLGVKKVLVAGGAQAIFALAYGTHSVPKVDKICGPGNQFVTAAKMMVQARRSHLQTSTQKKNEKIICFVLLCSRMTARLWSRLTCPPDPLNCW